MNIIEAARSGERFKRKNTPYWRSEKNYVEHNYSYVSTGGIGGAGSIGVLGSGGTGSSVAIRSGYLFTLEDLLAGDWETEEKKVEITYEQLKEAFEKVLPAYYSTQLGASIIISPNLKTIAKELGLLDD